MSRLIIIVTSIILLTMLGCASIPTGPSIMVLPGNGLSLEQFSNDHIICQQFATRQVSGTLNQNGNANAAPSKYSSIDDDQLHYDMAYIQCMHIKGHQVPVYGQFTGVTPAQVTSPYPPIPLPIPKLTPSAKPTQPNHNDLMPTSPKE